MLMEQPIRRPTVFEILKTAHEMSGTQPEVEYVSVHIEDYDLTKDVLLGRSFSCYIDNLTATGGQSSRESNLDEPSRLHLSYITNQLITRHATHHIFHYTAATKGAAYKGAKQP